MSSGMLILRVTLNNSKCLSADLCPTLCDTMDCSLTGSSVHGFLGKNTGVGCHFFLQGIFLMQWSNLYLCSSVHQVFDGPASLLFSCQRWRVQGERLWSWLHPYTWLSSITFLPWLPHFPPQAFSTTVPSLTSPWSVSPQSTAAFTVGLRHNP